MKRIIEANFHPVLAWHPTWPREDKKYAEGELWEETNKWNEGKILWLVPPDKKVREPIDYRGKGGVMTAESLEKEIRRILQKHDLKLVEPKN